MENQYHPSERLQDTNTHKEEVIVQPGDAEQHMLKALAQKEKQKYTGRQEYCQFGQKKQEIQDTAYYNSQQSYPYQGQQQYYQGYQNQPGVQRSIYQQNWENSQMPGFYPSYQQNQVCYQRWGGGFGRGHHRGRGKHFYQHQDRNNFYEYHPHPPFHGPSHHPPYGNPFFGVSYSQASEKVVYQPCQPVKSFQGFQPQTSLNESQNYRRGKGQQGWKCSDKRSRSKSSSSSSESDSDEDSSRMKKKYNNEISEFYTTKMADFFEKRNINQNQKQKIIRILRNKYPKYDAPIPKILSAVENLQHQNLLFKMRYVKVIRVLLKFDFNLNMVVPKLLIIQEKRKRKDECDKNFEEKFGKQIQPMLNHHQLIQKQQSKLLYLVDGNNIMPSIKHFRMYFQSNRRRDKIQCQVRLRYLLSFAFPKDNVLLFFDEIYPQQEIKDVQAEWLLNKTQQERYNQIQVIYGLDRKADDRIVQKVLELNLDKTEKEVILVSSDRELFMRCKEIMDVKHTGGRFFFKTTKVAAKIAQKGKKDQKKMVKSVIKGQLK